MGKAIKCSRCGRENDPSFAFCLDCGQSLRAAEPAQPAACAGCGAKLLPGFKFCGHCGHPVASPGPATSARPEHGAEGAESRDAPPRAQPSLEPAQEPGRAGLQEPAGATRATGFRLTAMRHDGMPGGAFPLAQPEVICGRTDGEIRLADDQTVSPRHARFTVRPGGVRVEDLGSVNGTFVRLRTARRLSVGEEVRLGRQLLRVEPLPRPAQPEEHGVRRWGTKDEGYHLRLAQLLEEGGLGEIFPLRPGENHVGREAGDVTFPSDRYVSARHARIDVGADEITLTDLGSSNGTFVKAVGPVDLVPGDQVLVGGQLLQLDA